jgi:hypothetical protein
MSQLMCALLTMSATILAMCLDFFIFIVYCITWHIPVFACLFLLMCARLTYYFANSHALTSVNSKCLLYIAWCGVRLSTRLSRVRSHWRTRYGTVMASRVWLTVSSLPPPRKSLSLSDNQLSVLPADVFSGLTSLRLEFVCDVTVGRVSCASWRESVYHLYVYGNAAFEVRTQSYVCFTNVD